ncbi:hypothetical protein [Novosphingobium sp. ZW T3_23]
MSNAPAWRASRASCRVEAQVATFHHDIEPYAPRQIALGQNLARLLGQLR